MIDWFCAIMQPLIKFRRVFTQVTQLPCARGYFSCPENFGKFPCHFANTEYVALHGLPVGRGLLNERSRGATLYQRCLCADMACMMNFPMRGSGWQRLSAIH